MSLALADGITHGHGFEFIVDYRVESLRVEVIKHGPGLNQVTLVHIHEIQLVNV